MSLLASKIISSILEHVQSGEIYMKNLNCIVLYTGWNG
jgi:hypothetical protein